MTMDNADAQAQRTGDALLLGEAGFDPPAATRIAALADEHMVSWTFWDYYPAGLIFRDQWPILIRPYPQLVSGTPASWGFDLASKNFTLRYATRRVAGGRFPAGSRTEVLLPRLQYPHGYRLAVSGADIASQPTAGRLVLCSAPGASDVALTVTPSGSGVTDLPAGPGRDVGCPGDSGEAATSVTGGAGPISVSGTTVSIPGSGTVRLPPSGRCLRGRTIQVRLRLARGTHLVGAAATINGRARGVHVGRGGRLSIRVGRGRSTRVTLRLRLRVRTRHGTRTIRITRRYRICGSA
jgi:hypothetical protein